MPSKKTTELPAITREQALALDKFAAKYGRTWRDKLRTLWYNGGDDREEDGHCLRQIRNQVQFAVEGGFIERYQPQPLTA